MAPTTQEKPVMLCGPVPKSLEAWAAARADKIEEVSDERSLGQGYWIYLRPGWYCDDPGLHIIHEDTIAEVKAMWSSVRKCECEDCRNLLGEVV